MSLTEQRSQQITAKQGWFGTTHWSVVLLAGQAQSTQADAALAKLCQTYWYPLYVFVRRQGKNQEDAQDLVQAFFARVLEKNYFKDAEREKGKFRSFLLMALKRFLANEWDRANRLKRGGGRTILSLDVEESESSYCLESSAAAAPEKAY